MFAPSRIVVLALLLTGIVGCADYKPGVIRRLFEFPFLGTSHVQTRPVILDSPEIGIIYDTKYEETLNSGKSLPLLEQAWRDLVEVLDEPAAVVGWKDGVSTWEVFFATNRDIVPATVGTDQVRHGNGLPNQARFGKAEVRIPKRRRGVDPKRVEGSAPSDDAVAFERVASADWPTFVAGVNDQLRRSRQHDLLLFVHGFNVDFESCLVRTAQIALDMPFNGAVVAYSWPTVGGVQGYQTDEPINAASVAPFAEFLTHLVAAVPPETRVNIVVHSMGNRIVMQAVGAIALRPDGSKPLAHIALCAPDVGVSDFVTLAPGVVSRSERVTLYTSAGDAALKASQVLHQEPRAGNVSPPVVVPGIETIDCSAVDFDFMGHGYYGANVDVLGDLFAALKQNHPAEKRAHLRRAALNDGQSYWHYQAHAPRMLWTWNFDDCVLRR